MKHTHNTLIFVCP